jgi:hypothetical protein
MNPCGRPTVQAVRPPLTGLRIGQFHPISQPVSPPLTGCESDPLPETATLNLNLTDRGLA